MKKSFPKLLSIFLLTINLLTINLVAHSQGCLPEGITFFTQEEIDNFQTNYPGCTEIEGDVIITDSEINNLMGLSVITAIDGSLYIDSTQLTNLQGLNALSTIGGMMGFGYNLDLVHLTGLDALTTVSGPLSAGFTALTDLTGMPVLNSIGGLSLHFTGTTSLTGLEGLTAIDGGLQLSNCFEVENLSGLENVVSIDGGLSIFNTGLKSLSGMDNIDPYSINGLYISLNDSLFDCDVWSICQYLADPGGTISIHNNATGCNSPEEVEEACLTGTEESVIETNNIQIFPNPAKKTISIISPRQTKIRQIKIFNQTGVLTIEENNPGNKIDVSSLQPGLYFVEIKIDAGIVREKLIIQ